MEEMGMRGGEEKRGEKGKSHSGLGRLRMLTYAREHAEDGVILSFEDCIVSAV